MIHSARPTLADVRQYFYPDRIKYFITSAIGFYRHDEGQFRVDDYQNTVQEADGLVRIRGSIHPINVVEPLLWLGQQLGRA
jgi:hypothetical protein